MIKIQLSAAFLEMNGLSIPNFDAQRGMPSTKPNFNQISKMAGLDRASTQTSLQNLFEEIGRLLDDEGNVEIDLGNFGKFGSINRQVTYSSLDRQALVQTHGK